MTVVRDPVWDRDVELTALRAEVLALVRDFGPISRYEIEQYMRRTGSLRYSIERLLEAHLIEEAGLGHRLGRRHVVLYRVKPSRRHVEPKLSPTARSLGFSGLFTIALPIDLGGARAPYAMFGHVGGSIDQGTGPRRRSFSRNAFLLAGVQQWAGQWYGICVRSDADALVDVFRAPAIPR